jgi:hypothetical protein
MSAMKDYEPPAGTAVAAKGKKKAKAKKDPNAPKRGYSSFMFFSNEVRAKVKEDNPEFSFGDIVSRVTTMRVRGESGQAVH